MALNETANLLIKISADTASAKAGFASVKNTMDGLASTALKVAGVLAGAFALRDVINTTQKWAESLDTLHDTLGISGQSAAEWTYAARIVGTTADDIATSFGVLTNKIGNSLPAIQQGTSDFDKWGIKVLDANKSLLSADDILSQVRDRINEIGPGLAARQLEMDLFGRSGGKLHDFLSLANDELKTMKEDLKALGLPTNVDELEAMNREGNRLGFIFDSLKVRLGSALLPILLTVGRALAALAGTVKGFGEALRSPLGIIKEVVDRFGKFITQIKEQGFVKAAGDLAGDVVSKIGEGLGNVGQWITTNFPIWRENLGKLWNGLIEWIGTTGIPQWQNFWATQVVPFGNWIVASVPTWLANFGRLVTDLLDWFRNTGWPSIVKLLQDNLPAFGQWIVDSVPTWLTNLGTLLGAVANWIVTVFAPRFLGALGAILESLPGWALGISMWFANDFWPAISAGVRGFVDKLLDGLLGPLDDNQTGFGAGFRRLVVNVLTQPFAMVGGIFDAVRWIVDRMHDAVNAAIQLKNMISPGASPAPSSGGGVGGPGSTGGGGGRSFAEGGIITRRIDNATIAEAGPEAIIPLDRAGSFGTTIIVNVSGNVTRSERELAERIGNELMARIGSRRSFAF